jgi:hypothetical protein
MRTKKRLLLLSYFSFIITSGIISGSNFSFYNKSWFFWESVTIFYAIWLFIDQKQNNIFKTSLQNYFIFFTIYAPIGLIRYLYKTRKKQVFMFLMRFAILCIVSTLLYYISESITSFINNQY